MKMWVEQDVNRDEMRGMRIAVIGYGSQGRAHAMNLRDSGFDVVVGLRAGGPSWKQARAGRRVRRDRRAAGAGHGPAGGVRVDRAPAAS